MNSYFSKTALLQKKWNSEELKVLAAKKEKLAFINEKQCMYITRQSLGFPFSHDFHVLVASLDVITAIYLKKRKEPE